MKANDSAAWQSYITGLESLPTLTEEWEQDLFRYLKQYMRDNMRIMELGCSNARWVKLLQENFKNIDGYGFDMSNAGFVLPDITYIQGDARNTGIENEKFDLVFSIGLVEHFRGKDLQQVLSEHVRIAKKGGIIIILVPTLEPYTPNYLKLKLMEFTGLHKGAPHFIVTGQKVSHVLREAGCKIELMVSFGWLLRWRKWAIPRFSKGKLFSTEAMVVARREV